MHLTCDQTVEQHNHKVVLFTENNTGQAVLRWVSVLTGKLTQQSHKMKKQIMLAVFAI